MEGVIGSLATAVVHLRGAALEQVVGMEVRVKETGKPARIVDLHVNDEHGLVLCVSFYRSDGNLEGDKQYVTTMETVEMRRS